MWKSKNKHYLIESYKKSNYTQKICAILIAIMVLLLIGGTVKKIIEKTQEQQTEQEQQAKQEFSEKEDKKREQEEKAKKEAERQAKLPKLTEKGIENMENIYHSDNKRVFLTFDDGPSTNTEAILDVLKQDNIKVTFFELGARVDESPQIVKRAYDEGHYIASHGYSHVYSEIYTSTQTVLDEYNQCVEAIRNAIGEPTYNPHLFRFPGGTPGGAYADLKAEAKQYLKDNGILSIDWNALTGDAEGKSRSVEQLIARLDETVGEKNSVVVLMHDSAAKTTTVEALPQVISYFKDRGYEFMNFYKIIV